MTAAGDLRFRMTFQQRVLTSDGYGNTEGDFADEFTVAAKKQARLGGEAVTAARLAGRQIYSITVRASEQTRQITPDWRARDERTGEIYNIRAVIDPEAHTSNHGRWIEMLCEEGVAT